GRRDAARTQQCAPAEVPRTHAYLRIERRPDARPGTRTPTRTGGELWARGRGVRSGFRAAGQDLGERDDGDGGGQPEPRAVDGRHPGHRVPTDDEGAGGPGEHPEPGTFAHGQRAGVVPTTTPTPED